MTTPKDYAAALALEHGGDKSAALAAFIDSVNAGQLPSKGCGWLDRVVSHLWEGNPALFAAREARP